MHILMLKWFHFIDVMYTVLSQCIINIYTCENSKKHTVICMCGNLNGYELCIHILLLIHHILFSDAFLLFFYDMVVQLHHFQWISNADTITLQLYTHIPSIHPHTMQNGFLFRTIKKNSTKSSTMGARVLNKWWNVNPKTDPEIESLSIKTHTNNAANY